MNSRLQISPPRCTTWVGRRLGWRFALAGWQLAGWPLTAVLAVTLSALLSAPLSAQVEGARPPLEGAIAPLEGAVTPPEGVRVFRTDGTPASWAELVEAAGQSRIVLLGEIHDDVQGHESRHALVRALSSIPSPAAAANARTVGAAAAALAGSGSGVGVPACAPQVLSLEMLETDVQLVVDEYQMGLITREHFRRAARPWENHDRDYEPYLEIARGCTYPVVAANPPRRYVNRVARTGMGGISDLSSEAMVFLPPLPVAPPSELYQEQWNALMGAAGGHGAAGAVAQGAHGGAAREDLPREDPVLMAQNLWDAGMAWAVAQAAQRHPAARVIHVAGSFHVEAGTGIPEHLALYLPDSAPLVVVAYPGDPDAPFDAERHQGRGDFILLTVR